jgi:hypothetical protein
VGVHLSSISFDQTDRPVSYRLADYLSDAYGRTCPDMESRLFFDVDKIRGAHLLTKKKMPAALPTLNEVARLIAQVGGFLGRKSDGEPGTKTIWRGLDQVTAAAETATRTAGWPWLTCA